jgi:hypothetical protein
MSFYFSYDPKRSSAKNVAHLLASENKFLAPTTFPDVNDCETYADEHGSNKFYSNFSNENLFFFFLRINEIYK